MQKALRFLKPEKIIGFTYLEYILDVSAEKNIQICIQWMWTFKLTDPFSSNTGAF